MQIRNCVVCGKQFTSESSRQLCCSTECSHERRKQQYREYYKKNYAEMNRIRCEKAKEKRAKEKYEKNRKKPLDVKNYAERQKAQTIEMYARVKIDE